MPKTTSISINLAKNRGISLTDRLLGFVLTIGRVIIIATELIALGAFIYRFSLDQTLVALHDSISQQVAIVNLLSGNEALFRNMQNRFSLASALLQQGSNQPTYLTDVVSFAPFDMNIQTIAVATDAIRIEATVHSVDSLTTFVNKLKSYKPVASVSIDRISNQTTTDVITVDITANLKQTNPGILAVPTPGGS